jgi:hypothetical protein
MRWSLRIAAAGSSTEIHRFRLAPCVRLRGAAETIGRTDGRGGRRRALPRAVG